MAANQSETILRDLFAFADVHINGNNPWDIQVHDEHLYARLLKETSLGLGEGYMDGWWDCPAIDQMIDRMLRANLDTRLKGGWKLMFHALKARLMNLQSPSRAFTVGQRHYDLGNDLFRAMLDQRLNYSCAYWKNASTLDEAQEAKLELVCKKIGLKPGMRVLELGCGWGSFAKYAAEVYGAEVVGYTVSREQLELGTQLCQGLPVEFRLQDYREAQGSFNAVISIGMLEHVGYKNYPTYLQVVERCLKPDGIALIHTIGTNRTFTAGEPWTDTYIFPNGILPSIARLGKAMEACFVMEDWHNFGPYYDRTLMAWYNNFERAWPELSHAYDERFHRMWRYYLLSSAGAFRARSQQLWQIVLTHRGTPQPDCRFS